MPAINADLIPADVERRHVELVPPHRRRDDRPPHSAGHREVNSSPLGTIDPDASFDVLRDQVEQGYEHKSYAYRAQRLEEFDRFLRRMQPGNLVLTTMDGKIYLGHVTGPVYFTESGDGLSNLRRDVAWHGSQRPVGPLSLGRRCRRCCRVRRTG